MQPSPERKLPEVLDGSSPSTAAHEAAVPLAERAAAGGGELAAGGPPPPPAFRGTAADVFDAVVNYSSELFKGNFEILRESYVPSRLPHREHQIRQVAEVLAPALKGSVPSNLLIYGKIGTGKTAVVGQVRLDMQRRAEANGRVTFINVNCASIDTAYSLLQTIGNEFANQEDERIPTGWSLDRVQQSM
ncbi:MAG: AAA family ATPase [Thermoplasmata archaeon]|nr:AAA family ATPase [Thermoplasmata archaeon]